MSPVGMVVAVFEPLGLIRDLVVLLRSGEMRHLRSGAPGPELGKIFINRFIERIGIFVSGI